MSAPRLPATPNELWARRYQIRRLLGEGSRKRVYLARDTRLDRDVALALIKSETLDPTSVARVQRETQTMGRLGDDPHIVTVHDVGEEEGQPYIVSQLMAGGSVEDLVQATDGHPPHGLDLEVVLRLGDHICRALEHAHAHGIIHRDLKPANVWLTADGTAKLGDFGLALARERSRVTVEGMMVGTVAYMAPEQALGKAVDARSDLYSLGALLYELLTGRPPFVGDGAVAVVSQHLHTQPVAPSWHNPGVPPPLEALVLQLLEKEPAKRPSAASAVRETLARINTQIELNRDTAPDASQSAVLAPEVMPAAANPLDRLDAGVFVGREQELTALRAAVEDALAGRGRVVLIAGEPGIGKTRMAQELATYAQLRGVQVLWGRCHEGGGAPAYWPWVQAIRTYVHERPLPELRAELGAGAPEIANVVSAVRERLPDLPAPARLAPEQERFRLFDSVTMFLKRAAAHQAIMLVIDDLHWADVPSLLLLQFLVREMDSERLVVVAPYRDEEAGPGQPVFASLAELTRAPVSRRMALAGLQEPEIAQLIERTAGDRPSTALITAVTEKTEGNPFFVGEVVRWLVAQGRMGKRASGSTGVPPSVREVIVRRLQRLSPECNELLTSAAVVGRDFPLALLARVRDQPEDALLELAEEAVAARVLTEVEVGRYSFIHALIRETLYGELSPARRRRLHRQIGEALESLHAARLEHHLPALAYHFSQAASPETIDKAVTYAQRAGDRSMMLTAYEDAVTYYEQVLHTLGRADASDRLRRAEVLLGLGKAEFGCGKPLEEGRTRYLEAATIAREVGAPELLARAALEFATGPQLPGIVDETRSQLLEEANEALAGHQTILHALVLGQLAYDCAQYSKAPERVTALSDEAVAIARRHGDQDALGYALVNGALAQWRPDSFAKRLEFLKELKALSKRIENKHLELQVHMLAVVLFIRLADRASLDREVEAYAAVAEELRLPYWVQAAHQLRAMRATISGRFADAERSVHDAFACGATVHPEFAQMMFGGLMFALRREQGRIAELEPVITALVERHPQAAMWRGALALLHCELGRPDCGRRELEHVLQNDLAAVPVEPWYWLVTIAVLAEVCAFVGDDCRAAALYDLLWPYGRMCVAGGDAVVCFGAAGRHLGLLAATMRRWDDACRHFDEALAINTGLGAPPLVARTQCDYAAVLLARGAPGDRHRAFELLTAAVDTAQQLGMKLLLERGLALKLEAQGNDSVDLKSSIDAVAAEVTEARPDLRAQSAPDGTVTIFFSDIEGFTAMTERLGDQRAHGVLAAHNRIIRDQLARHGGFEVKAQGDGFMVTFQSARRAVLCAVAVQRAFSGYAAEHPEEPIRVRIGLHTGEVIRDAEDFFGTAVNLAARIAGAARGGEILVSSVLKELTAGASEVCYGPGRPVTLKGMSGVRTVFGVQWGGEPPAALADPDALPPNTAVLRHEGAYWTLSYEGSTGRLKDTRGLRYLAQLLRDPGREFHAVDLVQGGTGEHRGGDEDGRVLANTGLEMLDPPAKAAYRRRLAELRDDLEEAERFNDAGRSARAREEIEAITAQLAAAVGLGGRDRTAGGAAERARSTVTKRIKDALKQIRELNPPLGDHVSRRVKTGVFCAYLPDNARPIEWSLD